MCVLDVYVMISMIFLCFKNLGLRNGEQAQASPVARLGIRFLDFLDCIDVIVLVGFRFGVSLYQLV